MEKRRIRLRQTRSAPAAAAHHDWLTGPIGPLVSWFRLKRQTLFNTAASTKMTKLAYQKPVVKTFGMVSDLTRASFDNSVQDSIFFNGTEVGQATGSLDACVSTNPKIPSGTCSVPIP